MSELGRYELRDSIAVLNFDDGKANALSFELIAAIRAAVAEAETSDDVGAVVIHGRDGRFSGGFDLGVMFGDDMRRIIELVADGGDPVGRSLGDAARPALEM